MIKKFKIFEKIHYQKEIFPDKNNFDKKGKDFINNFKQEKEIIKNNNFYNVSDVLDKYQNKEMFNKIYQKYIHDINIGSILNTNLEDILLSYLEDNNNIILNYFLNNKNIINLDFLDDDYEEISDKNDDISDEFLEQKLFKKIKILRKSNFHNLFNNYNDYEDFLYYIIENNKIEYYYYDDYYYYDKLMNYLIENIDKEYLTIYRKIGLPSNNNYLKKYLKEYKGVGKYWTYNKNLATIYNNKKYNAGLTLIADVNINNIDWEKTIYLSLYHLSEEQELRLYDDVTVNVKAFNVDKRTQKLIKQKRKYIEYIKQNFNLDRLKINELDFKIFKNLKKEITLDEPVIVKV